MPRLPLFTAALVASCAFLQQSSAFRVPIQDTDAVREVCSGMYGGKDAMIEVTFDAASSGQVALVIYEWKDVAYLGADAGENARTYICTTSAVRSGLCTTNDLGSFITSVPSDVDIDTTSIYTTPLRFSSEYFPTPTKGDEEPAGSEEDEATSTSTGGLASETGVDVDDGYTVGDGSSDEATGDSSAEKETEDEAEVLPPDDFEGRRKRDVIDMTDDIAAGISSSTSASSSGDGDVDEDADGASDETTAVTEDNTTPVTTTSSTEGDVPVYSGPIVYKVDKTGYYCVGIVPVTLVNSRSDLPAEKRDATHGEYSGVVLFKNTFEGELPAVEYPKIYFYLGLSIVYFILGCAWAWPCVQNLRELLPIQYYISGTIVFLVIEMLAQFAYYRYINKHGGGTSSLAFLFVIAVLNAARNSLSFFLLLIVSMGLSVVTQSLGSVMNKVRVLTGLHFIFGVVYSIGTVEIELDSASLIVVLLLIFPLSITLTAFLMWIIVSLNGTIMHLQARKQRYKLQMFQRLWRILVVSVIAVAAFFVVSSMSLSNRLDEDYAPNNWKYRWILLDGSLATIYLCAFTAIAWLWRPTRDNVRFSMSQELAQDEDDVDAEDYEIDALENGRGMGMGGHQPLSQHDDGGDDAHEREGLVRGGVGEENVVFQMGEDSDDDDEGHGRKGYRDSGEGEGSDARSRSASRVKGFKGDGKDD